MNHVTAADGSGDNNGENEVENPIGGPGFNFNTVEWLETFNGFVGLSLAVKYSR